jgi:hypothetical protein
MVCFDNGKEVRCTEFVLHIHQQENAPPRVELSCNLILSASTNTLSEQVFKSVRESYQQAAGDDDESGMLTIAREFVRSRVPVCRTYVFMPSYSSLLRQES